MHLKVQTLLQTRCQVSPRNNGRSILATPLAPTSHSATSTLVAASSSSLGLTICALGWITAVATARPARTRPVYGKLSLPCMCPTTVCRAAEAQALLYPSRSPTAPPLPPPSRPNPVADINSTGASMLAPLVSDPILLRVWRARCVDEPSVAPALRATPLRAPGAHLVAGSTPSMRNSIAGSMRARC
ncbi:hypothetical protein C8R46DRAFT_1252873 [Mycena filopes]|nr:hypothetical protein C8R46DRAFT_1252873 [Mycena filopes]